MNNDNNLLVIMLFMLFLYILLLCSCGTGSYYEQRIIIDEEIKEQVLINNEISIANQQRIEILENQRAIDETRTIEQYKANQDDHNKILILLEGIKAKIELIK
jgi:hypothetical protein